MKIWTERCIDVGLIGVGVAAILGSRGLPLWEGTTPGAGLYPTILGAFLVVAAGVWMGIRLLQRNHGPLRHGALESPLRTSSTRTVAFALIIVIWTLTLGKLGFVATSALGGAAIAHLIEPGRPMTAALIGIVGALALFGLLSPLLGMRLP